MAENREIDDYRALLAPLDELTAASIAEFGPDRVRCRSGCALCCHGLFDVGVLDALLLHAAWRDASNRDAIEARAEALLDKIATLAPDWRYPYDLQSVDDAEADRVLANVGMVACPVLDLAARTCSLYESRPFYCRLHGLKVRDRGEQYPMDTECELNFTDETPPQARWPSHDFSAQFTTEAALIRKLGADGGERFLIPAVTTSRFADIYAAMRK